MKHLVILVSLFLCGILQLSAQTEAAQTNKAQANTAQANTARSHAKPIVTNLEISYAHGYSAYEWDYYGVDIAPILFAGEKASLGIGAGVHNYAWGFPDNFGEGDFSLRLLTIISNGISVCFLISEQASPLVPATSNTHFECLVNTLAFTKVEFSIICPSEICLSRSSNLWNTGQAYTTSASEPSFVSSFSNIFCW